MNNTYYISWRTWHESKTVTPWDWYPMQRGSTFKRRQNSTSTLKVDQDLILSAYESRNQPLLDEIEREFIEDVLLSAFVVALDETSAQSEVLKYFPDAEIDKCAWVDEATKQKILRLFDEALRKKELGN